MARTLGTLNMALRLGLSKVVPFAVSPPVSIQLTTGDFKDPSAYHTIYRDSLQRAHRTTAALTGLGVVVLAMVTHATGVW